MFTLTRRVKLCIITYVIASIIGLSLYHSESVHLKDTVPWFRQNKSETSTETVVETDSSEKTEINIIESEESYLKQAESFPELDADPETEIETKFDDINSDKENSKETEENSKSSDDKLDLKPVSDIELVHEDVVSDNLETVDSLKHEPELSDDPAPAEDSQYAKNENDVEDYDPVIQQIVQQIVNDYYDANKDNKDKDKEVDPNPPNFEKDYSIKIPDKLHTVSAKEFIEGSEPARDFFGQILTLIELNKLSFPLERRMKMENGKTIIDNILFYDTDTEVLSEKQTSKFFNFPSEFVDDLKAKHKIITDNLPDINADFYEGSGYVIVGGSKYSWFSVLVIETLRKLGSKYPVEVILPSKDEYEKEFCEVTLPKLNARCVMLHTVFGDKLDEFVLTGYQYKAFALLASSFEHAFLLDADTYPVQNPDILFDSQLYLENTMITWPDYWRRTTSPVFYDIRGTKIGQRVRHLNDFWTDKKHYAIKDEFENPKILRRKVPLHDREGTLPDFTTESGEMLINKKIHFKALLLALYYNHDGQFAYYPLLSQGGAGEGDKETFVAASNYFNLNYYQLYKKPDRAYGFYKDGMYVDTSIIQYNPLKDYEILQEIKEKIKENEETEGFTYDYSKLFTDNFQVSNSDPMFYHVHETKLDPFHLKDVKANVDLSGDHIRNMGGDWPRFNFDLEVFLWDTVNRIICVEDIKFDYFSDKDKLGLCGDFMESQLKFLEESHYELLKYWEKNAPFDNLRRTKGEE